MSPTPLTQPSFISPNEDRSHRRSSVRVVANSIVDDLPKIRSAIRAAVRQCDIAGYQLTFVLVGDEPMSRLHVEHLGIDGTTDVLTFDLSDTTDRIEGEVYLCVDEAQRQAKKRRLETSAELILYAVHGVLHLLGYDDHSETDYQRMHIEEDRILRAIGIGAVFAPDSARKERR